MSYLVYLAGPLDDLQDQFNPMDWRMQFEHQAAPYKDICFVWLPKQTNPTVADSASLASRALIYGCDGLLAFLDGGFPFGTIREIEYARFNLGKPVAVVSTREIKSMMAHDLILASTQREGIHKLYAEMQEIEAMAE